eukprot:575447_1
MTQDDSQSLRPTDIHRVLSQALDFEWDENVKERRLILVAKNPPHGEKYHNLGREADAWPDGKVTPNDHDILSNIGCKKIKCSIINIDNGLQYFCEKFMEVEDKKEVAQKWVQCITVNNADELTHQLMACVFSNRCTVSKPDTAPINETSAANCDTDVTQKEEEKEQNGNEHDALSPERHKHKSREASCDDIIGKMRWMKSNKCNSWYPLLVLDTDEENATIWDGDSTEKVDKTSLYQRGDIHRKLVKQSDFAITRLLNYSHTMSTQIQNHHLSAQQLVRESNAKIQELIHREIKSSNHNIKWMKLRAYEPVLVIQYDDREDHCFVIDIKNRLHDVDPRDLLDCPPYKTTSHIAAHVKKLNTVCTNYPWQSKCTIECGRTKCSFWVDKPGWITTTRETITATIIAIESMNQRFIKYWVERDDDGNRVSIRSDTYRFKILSEEEYQIQTSNDKAKQLEMKNRRLTQKLDELRHRNTTHQETIQSLQSNNKNLASKLRASEEIIQSLQSTNDRLQTRVRQSKRRIEQMQSQKDDLEWRARQSAQDITNKTNEINELQTACHEAITSKKEFAKKFETASLVYERLKQESTNLEKRNKEQRKLVTKLRERNIENSPALDLSRGFPPIQDIVNDFGTVKSQYHVEAGKQTKKALKQKHKGYSRLRNHKFVCEILFDILMKSYAAMKDFEEEQYRRVGSAIHVSDINDERQKKRLERMVKETYDSRINMFKQQKAQEIIKDIKTLFELDLKEDAKLLRYAEECIAVCWLIVLVRDPMLSIEPQVFDQSNKGTVFNEQLYIEGFGSDIEEPLNFVVWPSIVRQDLDTQGNISKIMGVFVTEIPQWNKKKLRKMKAEEKEQRGDADKKEDDGGMVDEARKEKVEKDEKEEEERKEQEMQHLKEKERREDTGLDRNGSNEMGMMKNDPTYVDMNDL